MPDFIFWLNEIYGLDYYGLAQYFLENIAADIFTAVFNEIGGAVGDFTPPGEGGASEANNLYSSIPELRLRPTGQPRTDLPTDIDDIVEQGIPYGRHLWYLVIDARP